MNILHGAAHGLRSCLIGLVLLVGVPVGGVYAFSHWLGVWPKLRAEAEHLEQVQDMTRVARLEEGGESCIVVCLTGDGVPRITLALVVKADETRACERLDKAVRDRGEPVAWNEKRRAPFEHPACRFEATLKSVGSRAYLLGAIGTGYTARRPVPVRQIGPDELVAWVRIVSGIGQN